MNVFITGGLSGLGNGLALLFLKNGHRVGVCDLVSKEEASETLTAGLVYYQADVLNKEQLSEVINNFYNEGGLDIVIANAGISMSKAKIPDFDRGRKVIEINVIGTLNTFEPAIKIMKEQGSGQLVTLGSISGTLGLPGMAIYGASKSAIINFSESMEIDLYKFGIHVTTLAPGFIDTPLTRGNDHKMPFLMSQEVAVKKMYNAIIKKKGLYIFPFPLSFVSRILYHLPRWLYKAFMKYDPLGLSKH